MPQTQEKIARRNAWLNWIAWSVQLACIGGLSFLLLDTSFGSDGTRRYGYAVVTLGLVAATMLLQALRLKERDAMATELADANKQLASTNDKLAELVERIKVQSQLRVREAEGRVQEIFENAPYGIFLLRVQASGDIVCETINPFLERILNLTQEEIRTLQKSEEYPFPELMESHDSVKRCIETGSPEEYETWVQTPAGMTHFSTAVFPVRNEEGRVTRIAGFVRDITNHKQAEIARRESEEKFSKVFLGSPDGILITDLEKGVIIDANDAFLEQHKLDRQYAVGRTTLEVGVWGHQPQRDEFLSVLRSRGRVRNYESRVQVSGGAELNFLVSADTMDLQGRTCVLAMIRDMSEKRKAELALARRQEDERRLREEFTRQLIVSQEQERRRIAGALHDSVGQDLLLIKNKLHSLRGLISGGEALEKHLKSAFEFTDHAISEVRRISYDLKPHQLDHLGLQRSLRGMIEKAAANSSVSIEHHLEDVDDLFDLDAATDLFRIVQESLTNILRHSAARHARIILERDLKAVLLEIWDDGRGFDTKEVKRGLGLLNIAERVRILSATMTLKSKPGEGTSLRIVIPVDTQSVLEAIT